MRTRFVTSGLFPKSEIAGYLAISSWWRHTWWASWGVHSKLFALRMQLISRSRNSVVEITAWTARSSKRWKPVVLVLCGPVWALIVVSGSLFITSTCRMNMAVVREAARGQWHLINYVNSSCALVGQFACILCSCWCCVRTIMVEWYHILSIVAILSGENHRWLDRFFLKGWLHMCFLRSYLWGGGGGGEIWASLNLHIVMK